MADLYYFQSYESAAERLQFVDSLLVDNKHLFLVAVRGEGGVRGPNRMHGEANASNERPASTLLPGRSNSEASILQI